MMGGFCLSTGMSYGPLNFPITGRGETGTGYEITGWVGKQILPVF